MIKKHKTLLFVLSLLMISLISFNTSFINAESNKTIINFIDEDGNQLDIKDTVSIVKLEDQGGTKVPVSVYIKDGKETTDYDNGTPLNELEIKDGKLEIEGLTKDDEYLLTFDNDYVFQKEENDETNYFLFGAFKGEKETYINSSDIKSVDELTLEQLEEVSGNKEIMGLGTGWISFTSGCAYYSGSVTATSNDIESASCSGNRCEAKTSATQGSVKISLSCNGKSTTYTWNTSNSSYSLSCSECNLPNAVCTPSSSRTVTCSSSGSATQYYNVNGGSWCGKDSDTRYKTASTRTDTCSSKGQWSTGTCYGGSWSGSVSAPSCSKDDTTDYATVAYNGNKGSGSTDVKLSKSSETISRAVHYSFNGFDNYQTSFTSDTTAYAQYSVSSRDSYPSVQLPTAYRDGYTFTGWSADGNTYNEGQTVNPGGDKTYTATWSPNSYEYTIEFRSSTGKLLDTRKETHKFDETVTISHEPIPGYEVSDQQVKWDKYQNGYVMVITYQIITYDIEYSLEVGNRYPNDNSTINNNLNVATYDVEDETIPFYNPTRRGYSFKGWYLEDTFENEITNIPAHSTGDVKIYAKFEADYYPLTVTNTNDRVSVTGTINGETYTLAPKQSITKQILFDADFTVTSDTTDPVYYTADFRNPQKSKEYRSELKDAHSYTTSMDEGHSINIGATRNVKTFTVELKNDNEKHSVENTVTVKIYDNLI